VRDTGERQYRDTVTIVTRTKKQTTERGGSLYTESRSDIRCSMQPLGDTGRRQDRDTSSGVLSGQSSWRCWFSAREAFDAGLVNPFVRSGDAIEWNGIKFVVRGKPIPQRRDRDGSTLTWSVDVDGIES
jgi:hypothetical protein